MLQWLTEMLKIAKITTLASNGKLSIYGPLSGMFERNCFSNWQNGAALNLRRLQHSRYIAGWWCYSNTGHAKDVPFPGDSFFGILQFSSYWTQKAHWSYRKEAQNQFLEKSNSLIEKLRNFAMKGFTQTLTDVFLPNFVEIGKAEVTKLVSVHRLAPFFGSRQKFLPSFWHVLPNFVQFSRRNIQKCLPGPLQYRRKANIGFSPTANATANLHLILEKVK